MWQSIVKALSDFSEQWAKFTLAKKTAAIAIGSVIIACLVALGVWVGEKSYAPLYTDLQPDQSINLVKILQQENIPYSVSENGQSISIPPELVQQTLMKLAVKGMPAGQKPGMELFDKESFGTSSYVQRINYVRALQGELTRTINTLRSVKRSSVHISMPPKSSYFEKSEDPKASVVVDLHMGKDLTRIEIKGIQNLVASSVEGLRPERVTVVDSSGVALSKTEDALSAMSATMAERQQQIENELSEKIEDMVGHIVGRGRVVARVTAELDFDPLQEEEKIVDPENSAVTSQEKTEDNLQATRPQAAGVAGAEGALPGPASAPPEAKQNLAKSRDNSQYEVSTKLRKKEKALGMVKRLTVAVLVSNREVAGADGKTAPQPVTKEQKDVIEKLVRSSIGFVEGRDTINVESSDFAKEDMDSADEAISRQEQRHLIFSLVRYGTVGLFILLFFSFVVRPFVRWVTGISTPKVETILPKTVEELEEMQVAETNALPGLASLPVLEETVDLEKAEGELLKQKVVALIEMSPGKAAQVITDWISASDAAANSSSSKKGRSA
jgi:flagellar M-ring protein FliF